MDCCYGGPGNFSETFCIDFERSQVDCKSFAVWPPAQVPVHFDFLPLRPQPPLPEELSANNTKGGPDTELVAADTCLLVVPDRIHPDKKNGEEAMPDGGGKSGDIPRGCDKSAELDGKSGDVEEQEY